MSNVKWTSDQLRAINSRGSSLLVSAAAGSGKTAVLVERLLRRIVDEGLDITEFLIITYTKAAASELRRKISDALLKYSAEHPGDRHIRRQIALANSARISTVHSFCSWLLKTHADSNELSGGERVLDENEVRSILADELSALIDEKYQSGDEDFLALAGYLSGARSDRLLASSVLELYDKSESHPYPDRWLLGIADSYNMNSITSITQTKWGEYAFLRAGENVAFALEALSLMINDVSGDAAAYDIYAEFLENERDEIARAVSDDWNTLRENLKGFTFSRLPSSKGLDNPVLSDRVKAMQALIKSEISEIHEKLLPESSETLIAEIRALSPYMKTLAGLAGELSRRFRREKLRRGALDYSDLEHLSIELLIESYDEVNDVVVPTEKAKEISLEFSEILLDEFQDSNCVQDIIFRAVSKEEKNIVMVGDVKQSIYRFRLADPTIFMKKYKSFIRYDDALGDEPRCITLSQNFRSRPEVLHASNALFSKIMTEKLGDVNYDEDQYLIERENIPDPDRKDMKCEFHLIDRKYSSLSSAEAEAGFIARRISYLVESGFEINDKDGTRRAVTYRDFAILLRSASGKAQVYEQALSANGIPFISPRADGLLQKSEVNAIVSYLTVIDNPTADIQLLAALRSPLFGFSADDFALIRRSGKGALIDAMKSLSREESETAKKCRAFLNELSNLRTLSRGMSASSLIREVYNRTSALGMFGSMKNGAERQRNLIEFYRCAEACEGSGYFGLYKFISYIAKLAERGGDIPSPTAHASNAVTIMTIHKSKGLEFPIVFLGGSIRQFNTDDLKRPILIHPQYGVGLRFRNEKEGYECSTLARDVIADVIAREMKSEEMRILYVAMTRAREKLYIIASHSDAQRMIEKTISENAFESLDQKSLSSRMGTQDWFMLPILRSQNGTPLLSYANLEMTNVPELGGIETYLDFPVAQDLDGDAETVEKEQPLSDDELSSVYAMLNFEYPHAHSTEAPSKVTATGISHSENGGARLARRKKPLRPSFMRERSLTPTERGTALHMAMQFADFERCKNKDGARDELLRLTEERYLTKAQAGAVEPSRICAFVNSEIGIAMQSAKRLEREYKFSVLLPADEMLPDEALSGETVLLQGVMDMFFENNEGDITIVDFKTDRKKPEGEILEKYKTQLKTYKRALFEMTGKTAKHLILYLASLDDYIEI